MYKCKPLNNALHMLQGMGNFQTHLPPPPTTNAPPVSQMTNVRVFTVYATLLRLLTKAPNLCSLETTR